MGNPPPRITKKRTLLKIVKRFGCGIDLAQGKGAHFTVKRSTETGLLSFTLPDQDEYFRKYVIELRKNLELDEAHGVSDEQFYGT